MRVKLIRRQGHAQLVEWHELGPDGTRHYFRSVLPWSALDLVGQHEAEHDDPHRGIPYGEPWEEYLMEAGMPEATAAGIANELRRMGIWTVEELQADPETARAAFQKGYGMDVQRLRLAAYQRSTPSLIGAHGSES